MITFIIYGMLGWAIEIFFTGIYSLIQYDVRAKGTTYLWMFPIWGAGAIILGQLNEMFFYLPFIIRSLIYLVTLYSIEFFGGIILRFVFNSVPWDYSGKGVNIAGLIRLDYAPFWYLVCLLFEPINGIIINIRI